MGEKRPQKPERYLPGVHSEEDIPRLTQEAKIRAELKKATDDEIEAAATPTQELDETDLMEVDDDQAA